MDIAAQYLQAGMRESLPHSGFYRVVPLSKSRCTVQSGCVMRG